MLPSSSGTQTAHTWSWGAAAQDLDPGKSFLRRESSRPGHEPVGYPEHLSLRADRESELLIEVDIFEPVGLEVRERTI
jgi:hypothetical protein